MVKEGCTGAALHAKTMFRSLWVLDGLRHRDRLLGWRAAYVGGLALAVVIVTENDPLEE